MKKQQTTTTIVQPFAISFPWVRVTLPIPAQHAEYLNSKPPELRNFGLVRDYDISQAVMDDSVSRLAEVDMQPYTVEMPQRLWDEYQAVAVRTSHSIEDVLRYVLWRREDVFRRVDARMARKVRRESHMALTA